MSTIKTLDVTIASGQTVSPETAVADGHTLVGIETPAALTGTTLTLQVASEIGGTFQAFHDLSGVEVSIAMAADRRIRLLPSDFAGVQYFKIVSGSTEAADRTFKLFYRIVE